MRIAFRRCFTSALFAIAFIAFWSAAAGLSPYALPEIVAAHLPPQALETLQLIKQGGPFPYDRDGAVFGNRERLLPVRERGYYREYTVKTPGARDRGTRRVVAGGCALPGLSAMQRQNKEFSRGMPDGKRAAATQRLMAPCSTGEYYYTDDHYASFRHIRE